MRSNFPVFVSAHCAMSLSRQVHCGYVLAAVASIAAELSRPVTAAFGQRRAAAAVLLPGPQPRSMIVRGASRARRAARSMEGCVRSLANFRYCELLHVFMRRN